MEIPIIEEFIQDRRTFKNIKNLTVKNYSSVLNQFYTYCELHDDSIIEENVFSYINVLKNEEILDTTIHKHLVIIKSFIKYLKRLKSRQLRVFMRNMNAWDDRIAFNELSCQIAEYDAIINIPSVRNIPRDRQPFTKNEMRKILDFAKSNRFKSLNYRNHLILEFIALGTGARNTATRQLEIADCDFGLCFFDCQNCIPTVRILRKGKRGKIEVLIKKSVCRELKKFITITKPTKYVFESRNGGSLSIQAMNNILDTILKKADIPKNHRSIHSLRTFFITQAQVLRTLLSHIARQVDHVLPELKSLVTYETYTRFESARELSINFPEL